MGYPGNYGYIPNTISGDNDPIDVLLICDYPIYPGVIVNVKIIGVLLTTDEHGNDEKILVVPSPKVDPNFNDIHHYTDLPKHTISKIKHFFQHYKDTEEHKWVIVKHFKSREVALELIHQAKAAFNFSLFNLS